MVSDKMIGNQKCFQVNVCNVYESISRKMQQTNLFVIEPLEDNTLDSRFLNAPVEPIPAAGVTLLPVGFAKSFDVQLYSFHHA